MRLRTTDYALVRVAQTLAPWWRHLGDLETDLLGQRLAAIPIDRPVFVTGLARSGTTILLEILSGIDGVATHRYRDFPFLWSPYVWNLLQGILAEPDQPVERPHKDRIVITRESPEAFEEPIWQHFFPHLHSPQAIHVLPGGQSHPRFEAFFKDHIRKIVLLRNGRRYVSKGNYNVTRIEYVLDLFPDARIVVPMRDPFAHVASLVRQHRLFLDYAATDRRVGAYLRAAGHYEFGPQRVPVNVTEAGRQAVARAWADGDDAAGYAHLWQEIYGYVARLIDTVGGTAARIKVVRYEDLCSDPADAVADLLDFADLAPEAAAATARRLDHISAPPGSDALSPAERRRLWPIVADVAGRFGYSP